MRVKAYHGSPKVFDKFDINAIGSTTGTAGGGFGLYFTTDEEEATMYGDNIYNVELSLLRGCSVDYRTFSDDDISELLANVEKLSDTSYIECWGDYKSAFGNLCEIESDSEIIGDIINAVGDVSGVLSAVVKMGISHAVTNGFNNDSRHYILFDSKFITIK